MGKRWGRGTGGGVEKDDESGKEVERESGRSQRDLAALLDPLTNTKPDTMQRGQHYDDKYCRLPHG